MLTIDPKEISTSKLHHYMLGAIAPRPIAFASTMDKDGNPNLAPFSFFNAFGSNPPILIFSPSRTVQGNTTKHTLENAMETREVVINVVSYAMLRQMSIASMEYPKEVNEFIKSGFTPIESETVKPFRVKESPAQFECKVTDIIETGTEGGAGNLIISQIQRVHISEDVLDDDQRIDQTKIDLVARMGGSWYARAHGDAIFQLNKPGSNIGIGFDSMPDHVKNSTILTGNDLGQLASVDSVPEKSEIEGFRSDPIVASILDQSSEGDARETMVHENAQSLLKEDRTQDAWKLLLLDL